MLLLLAPAEARAQVKPKPPTWDWLVMPFIGLKSGGSTSFLELEQAEGNAKLVIGGSVALLGSGILGVEGDLSYVPNYFERNSRFVVSSYALTLGGNVILTVPLTMTREGLRPYFVGGGGWMRGAAEQQLGLFEISMSKPGITLGGGAIGMLSDRTGLRFDFRYQRSVGHDEDDPPDAGPLLSFWRFSIAYIRRF